MAEEDAAAEVVQLIDDEGEFAADSAERFMVATGVAGYGLSYAIVSVMRPQSSVRGVKYVRQDESESSPHQEQEQELPEDEEEFDFEDVNNDFEE